MADQPFPFLDLPILVVVKILRKMGFIQLYILSQISPLMKRVIKSEVRKQNFKIAVDIRERAQFDFNFLKDGSLLETIRSYPKSTCSKPTLFIGKTIFRIGWNDTFNGAKVMYKEIEEVFSIPVDNVKIHLPSIEGNYKPITRWLKKIGPNISKVEIEGKKLVGTKKSDFLAYIWTMEQLRPSKELLLLAEPREYHIKGTLNLNVEKVIIGYGEWVSVENLVEIKSSDIKIQRSIIPTQNIIWILHQLRRGSMPDLKNLRIEFEQGNLPDCEAVFNSLGLVLIQDEPEGEFPLENGDNCVIRCIVVSQVEVEGGEEVEVIHYSGLELKIERGEE